MMFVFFNLILLKDYVKHIFNFFQTLIQCVTMVESGRIVMRVTFASVQQDSSVNNVNIQVRYKVYKKK